MENKSKILYISIIGMSESLGKSQVLEYLKNLSAEYEMHLHTFEKDVSEHTLREIQSIMDVHNIKWSYQAYDNKFGLFSTFTQIFCEPILKLSSRFSFCWVLTTVAKVLTSLLL